MKKLLILAMLLLTTPAFAGIISVDAFISGNDVTIAHLEQYRVRVVNEINGYIEGGINIKAGSIVSDDMAASISPVQRWDEAFNDFTVSGMLPATSVNLTSNISAGQSYVDGIRVDKTITAHTYSASKDTYVYINKGGFYQYEEVAVSAAAPTTPAGSLYLAIVTTDGDNITTVADSRTTSIQITIGTTNFPSHHRDRATVTRNSSTTFTLGAGDIAIGSSIYTRTSNTSTKNITTDANWIEGEDPSGDDTTIFLYAYNNTGTTWDFLYSSADPVHADTADNTDGMKRYYEAGGTEYRALAWVYKSADAVRAVEYGNIKELGTSNTVYAEMTSAFIHNGTSYGDVPDVSNIHFYSVGNPVNIEICGCAEDTVGNPIIGIEVGGTVEAEGYILDSGGVGKAQMCVNYQEVLAQGDTNLGMQIKSDAANNVTLEGAEARSTIIITEK